MTRLAFEYGRPLLGEARQHVQAYIDHAWACLQYGRVEEARAAANMVLAMAGADPLAWYFSAHIARHEGDLLGFAEHVQRAFALPHVTATHTLYRLAARALVGDWVGASRDLHVMRTIWSIVLPVAGDPPAGHRGEWHGESIAGARLLLHSYRNSQRVVRVGFGECLHTLSWAPHLHGLGARLLVDPHPELRSLVRASVAHLPRVELVSRSAAPAQAATDYDYACNGYLAVPAMVSGLPDGAPALVAPAGATPHLGPGIHIGIAWAAADRRLPHEEVAASRSIPLDILVPPLLAIPGAVLHCLQVGPIASDADAYPTIRRHPFPDFGWAARLVSGLDCVVSADTSTCHLAAGLGVPTLTLLSMAADPRWGVDGESTVWYRHMTLVRQSRLGDWASAVARAAELIATHDVPPRRVAPLGGRR